MSDTSTARFIQGTASYSGKGLSITTPLENTGYVVPAGTVGQPVYFRGGNSGTELIYVALVCDGTPIRLFPIGAKAATHVSLRVVEDLLSDTQLELQIAAPEGATGEVVFDLGVVEY